jgi:N-acetylglucosaminyldiphosphoundecaprenol N-acetyl-beta-D-mannosaminyltransferase
MNQPIAPITIRVLNTPLTVTSYADFLSFCSQTANQDRCTSVDFSNTHIVTMRRHEPWFRKLTDRVDYFIPDGMPLVWCLNARGAKMLDRVYGPTFLRYALQHSPPSVTHYFFGASQTCLDQLLLQARKLNPSLKIVGSHNGYIKEPEETAIVAEINRLAPDFIWIGLGTPKQQAFINRYKAEFRRGVIFAVGFAFDVNAGTKKDAPAMMQRLGLTWVYRLLSEPRRLFFRYLKYNTLFLYYLIRDTLIKPGPTE